MTLSKMNRIHTIALVVVVIAAIGVFGWLKYQDSRRFYIVPDGDGIAYRIDRRTGELCRICGNQLQEVQNPEKEPKLVELSRGDVESLEGRGGYHGSPNFFFWRDLQSNRLSSKGGNFCYLQQKKGEDLWLRKFVETVDIRPFSSGDFLFNTLDGKKAGAVHWGNNQRKGNAS